MRDRGGNAGVSAQYVHYGGSCCMTGEDNLDTEWEGHGWPWHHLGEVRGKMLSRGVSVGVGQRQSTKGAVCILLVALLCLSKTGHADAAAAVSSTTCTADVSLTQPWGTCGTPTDLMAGQVSVLVVLKDAGGSICSDCTGTLSGTLGGVASSAVTCTATTPFCQVSWSNFTAAGSQQLALSLNGTPISGSPYTVIVSAADDGLDATVSTSFIGGAGSASGTVNTDMSFTLTLQDQYSNVVTSTHTTCSKLSFSMQLSGTSSTLAPTCTYLGGGVFQGAFRTNFAGSWIISVIGGSRIMTKTTRIASDGFQASQCSASVDDTNPPRAAAAGSMALLAKDQFGNVLTNSTDPGVGWALSVMAFAALDGGSSAVPTMTFGVPAWSSGGSYAVSFQSTRSGQFSVAVSIGGVGVSGSPVAVRIEPALLSGGAMSPSGNLSALVAGISTPFTVRGKDAYGNAHSKGSISFSATLSNSSGATVQTLKTTAGTLGEGSASVIVTLSAPYSLSLALTGGGDYVGSPIIGAGPYTIAVNPVETGNPASFSWVPQDSSQLVATAGQGLVVKMWEKDAYGNKRTLSGQTFIATLSGAKSVSGTVTDVGGGQYNMSALLTLAGNYAISVTTAGSTAVIFTEAFSVKVGPAVMSEKGTLRQDYLEWTGGGIGQVTVQAKLGVKSRDEYGNTISTGGLVGSLTFSMASCNPPEQACIGSTAPAGTHVPHQIGVADAGSGFYGMSYTTTIGGHYYSNIKLGGLDIYGSPFDILVNADNTVAARSFAFGPGMDSCGLVLVSSELDTVNSCAIATSDAETTFGVRLVDAYGNQRLSSSGNTDLLVFNTTTVSLIYNLGATGPILAANQKFSIQYDNGVQVVGYPATVSGRYSTSVVHRYCTTVACPSPVITGAISNSPVFVFVAPAAAYAPNSWATGMGMSLSTAGVASSFLITTRDKFMNYRVGVNSAVGQDSGWDLTMLHDLGDPFKDVLSGTIVGQHNGTYLASFIVTRSGTYKISIKRDGLLVSNSSVALGTSAGAAQAMRAYPNVAGIGSYVSSGTVASGFNGAAAIVYVNAMDEYGNQKSQGGDQFTGLVSAMPNTTINQVDYKNGTYVVMFYVTKAGSYQANVFVRGAASIKGSPLTLAMSPGHAVPWYSEVFKSNYTTAGTSLSFKISARDMFYNDRGTGGDTFNVACRNTLTGDYSQSAVQDVKGDGIYNGLCFITRSGAYVVEVTSAAPGEVAKSISGSPFSALVEPGIALPEKSGAFGDATTLATAGVWSTFRISARDNYYNPNTGAGTAVFYMSVVGAMNQTIPVCPYSAPSPAWGNVTSFPAGIDGGAGSNGTCQSKDVGSGSFRLSYMWTVAGVYTSEVKIDTGSGPRPIQQSIYQITIKPTSLYTPKSRASGEALTVATAGADMTFVVSAKDVYDNVRTNAGGALAVTVLDPSTSTAATASSTGLPDGNFEVRFKTTRSGNYTISVRDSTSYAPLSNSPSTVIVKPTRSLPANFIVVGSKLNDAVAAEEVHFSVLASDEFGNLKTNGGEKFSIDVVGGWRNASDLSTRSTTTLGGSCGDMLTGSYDCLYMSTTSGRFQITVNATNPVSLVLEPVPGSPFSIYVSTGPISAVKSVSFLRTPENATRPLRILGPTEVHSVVAGANFTFIILAKDRFGNPRTTGGDTGLWSVNTTFAGSFNRVGLEYETWRAWRACSVGYLGDVWNASYAASGEYVATYTATISGKYIAVVSFNGTRINSTAHTVHMYPALAESRMFSSTFPPAKIGGGVSVGIRFTTAGVPSTFMVYARDRFGNRLTQGGDILYFNVSGESATNRWIRFNGTLEKAAYHKYSSGLSTVDPSCNLACVSDAADGTYMVALNPTISGQYRVMITRNASGGDLELICGSGCKDLERNPYNFSTEATDIYPPLCDASGEGLTAAFAGVVATFDVQARDIFGNKRLVDRFDPVMSQLQGITVFNGEFPTSSVAFGGAYISPDSCKCVLGQCTGCAALKCGGDFCGNPEPGYPRVRNTHVGLYQFSYLITQAAKYTITVRKMLTLDDQRHILGSPFPITLTAGPTDPLSCTVTAETGTGLYRSVAGVNVSVVIQTRDYFGNLRHVGGDPIIAVAQHGEKCAKDPMSGVCVKCTARDSDCLDAGLAEGTDKPVFVHCPVLDLGNNDYVMSYVITVSGFYTMSLRLNTTTPPTHLGGRTRTRSPFPLQISPAPMDPEMSTVTGEGTKLATIERESVFYLWPRDRYGNSLAGSSERVNIALCSSGLVCAPSVGSAFVEIVFFNRTTGMTWPVDDKYASIVRPNNPLRGTSITTDLVSMPDGSTKVAFKLFENVHPLGDYQIDVRVDGRLIRGAPLNMTVYPVDPNPFPLKSSVVPGPDVVAGKKGTGQLTVRNRYGIKAIEATNSNVFVQPYVSNVSPTEPKVINLAEGVFDVTFQTTRAGIYMYSVQVTNPLGGFQEVVGSPLTMTVVPWLFDPAASLASFVSGGLIAGTVVDVALSSRDSYYNELLTQPPEDSYVATLSRQQGTQMVVIPAVITKNAIKGWNALFQTAEGQSLTTISGVYRLDVTNQGVAIVNSPFTLNVLPAAVEEKMCAMQSEAARLMTAGVNSPILIQSKDRFNNDRTLNDDSFVVTSNSSTLGGPMTVKFDVAREGVTRANIMLTKVGSYVVSARLKGIQIINSPFTAVVVPGQAVAQKCFNSSSIPFYSIAGQTLSYLIQAVDFYGNLHTSKTAVFDVTLKGFDFLTTFNGGSLCTGTKCVNIVYIGRGLYNVTFTPTVASDYLMEAFLVEGQKRTSIAGSPWRRSSTTGTLNVVPSIPNMPASKLGGTGIAEFTSGEEATFTLYARDMFGNAQIFGGANVTATVEGGSPVSIVRVKVIDECQPPPATQDLCGIYTMSYMQTLSGSYSLTVSMNELKTAPIQVAGYPAEVPDPSATGLPYAPADNCPELCSDNNCCLVGEGASYGYIGVQNTFIIEARDVYGNKMTSGGQPFSIEVVGQTLGEGSILDLGDGQYLARYKVLVKGIYTLSVRLRGMHIGRLYDDCSSLTKQCWKGSPFVNLGLSPMGTGLEGLIFSGDLYQERLGVVAVQYVINVDSSDGLAQRTLEKDPLNAVMQLIVPGDPTVTVFSGSPTLVASLDLQHPNKDVYTLGIRTTKAGRWLLSVMSGNVHCIGSPFTLDFSAGLTVPDKTLLEGSGRFGAVVGQAVSVFIQTLDVFENARMDSFENVRYGVAESGKILAAFNASVQAGVYQSSGDRKGWFKGTYTGPALPNAQFSSLPYYLYVWVGSLALTPIPITIYRDHSDMEPGATIVYGKGLKVSTAGAPVTFTIETRDRFSIIRPDGGADLTVYVTDPNGRQKPYTPEDKKNGLYVMKQDINMAGQYSIIFMLGLPTGPWQLQGLAAALVIVPGDPFPGQTIFTDEFRWIASKALRDHNAVDQAEFVVTVKDEWGNQVLKGPGLSAIKVSIQGVASPLAEIISAYCTDKTRTSKDRCQDVDLNGDNRVWHDDDGMYRVVSAATASGNYIVSVQLNSFQVLGSPQTVAVSSGVADDERSFIAGDGTVGGVAGDQGYFSVQARDSYGNRLDKDFIVVSNIVDSAANSKAAVTKRTTLSSMDVTYSVTAAGDYGLIVELDGKPMQGSPFSVSIVPNVIDYRACYATGSSLSSAVAGVGGIFLVNARDLYGNQITVGGHDIQISITGQTLVVGAIQDLKNGSYVGTYQIQIAGSYGLRLLVGTDEFFYGTLNCVAGEVGHEMTAPYLPVPQRIQAGDIVTWEVQARDKFGSKIISCKETSLTYVEGTLIDSGAYHAFNGTSTLENGTTMCDTGVYSGSFQATLSGKYRVSVMIADGHIFGSPFATHVRSGPSASFQCYAYGNQLIIAGTPAAELAIAGKRATFTIQSRDFYGNEVLYDPFAPISRFNVTLQLSQTTCDTTTGLPLDPYAVCQQATVTGGLDSTFSVVYTPTYAGKFEVVTMLVDANNKFFLISNSPFTTVVYPAAPDTGRIVMVSPPDNVTADMFTSFSVVARDLYDNRLTKGGVVFDSYLIRRSDIQGSVEPYRFAANVNDNSDGSYEVSFKVSAAGTYALEVLVTGTRILNSPHALMIMPDMINYGECTVEGNGIVGGLTGRDSTFVIYSRDTSGNQLTVGGANFLVRIETPSDLARQDGLASVNPVPKDNGDGTYSVTYQSGETSITGFTYHVMRIVGVSVAGETVIRGGFKDRVLWEPDTLPATPGRTVAYGGGVVGGWVGSVNKFKIQLRNKDNIDLRTGGMQVTASMQSAFEDVPIKVVVTIVDLKDGTFEGAYLANIATVYYASVRLSGEHILGSPFRVELRPMTSSPQDSAVRATNIIGVVGESVTFLITAKDNFGNNQVYDPVSGPDFFTADITEINTGKKVVSSTQNNEDGTYILAYTATVSGLYNMKVKLRGEEVPTGNFEGLVVLTGKVVTSECGGAGAPPTMAAGTNQVLLVYARDIYGNLVPEGLERFNATLSGPTGIIHVGTLIHCGAEQCGRGDAMTCPCPDGLQLGVYAKPYSLTATGAHALSVKRDGFEVPGFPAAITVEASFVANFKTTIAGCERVCQPQLIRCTGAAFECVPCACPTIRTMRAGVVSTFDIQSRDTYGNKVTLGRKTFRVTAQKKVPPGKVSCLMSEGCTPSFVEGVVQDGLDGSYHVSWILAVLGDYTISVTRSQEHIEGSPFDLTVVPGPASASVDGSVFALDPVATAGQQKSFTIQARDVYGNKLRAGGEQFVASLTGDGLIAGTFVSGQVYDQGDGTYLCLFKTVLAGSFSLEVQHNGNTIAPGVVSITVLPALARADFSTIKGTGLSPLQSAGSIKQNPFFVPPTIFVIARDSFKNIYNFDGLHMEVKGIGPQPFSLNSTDPSVSEFVACGPRCGQYKFSNSLQVAGNYKLTIYLHKKDMFGAIVSSVPLNTIPYEFKVAGASTSPADSFFQGAGSTTCNVDGLCSFQVQAVDVFGNILDQGGDKFIVTLTYVASDATRLNISGTVTPANQSFTGGLAHNQGLYDAVYRATRSGVYLLQVTRYGQGIKGSPRAVTITPGAVRPGACTASGGGHMGGVLTVLSSLPLTFNVHARDQFGNTVAESILNSLTFSTSPSTPIQPTITTSLLQSEGWVYNLNYIPTAVGSYMLTVKVGGINVMGSPFAASVLESTSGPANYVDYLYTTAEGLVDMKVTVGIVSTMTIKPRSKSLKEIRPATSNYLVRMLDSGPAPALCPLCTSAPLVMVQGQMTCCWDKGDSTRFPTVKILSGVAGIQQMLVGEERFDVAAAFAHISGSPFALHMMPAPASATNCTVESLSTQPVGRSVAGFPNQLRFVVRDFLGNQVTYSPEVAGKLDMTITASDTGQKRRLGINDENNGAFYLTYSVTRSANYLFDAKISGAPFGKASPFTVVVSPDIMTTKTSTAEFTWPIGATASTVLATAGVNGGIAVQARDVYGNKVSSDTSSFQVMVSGRVTALSLPAYQGGGRYTTQSLLTLSSRYTVSVYNVVGGCSGPTDCDHVISSPFSILVSPSSVDPAQCTLSGPGKRSGMAGAMAPFQITMRDSYQNKITAAPPGSKFSLSASSWGRQVGTGKIHVYDAQGTVPVVVEGVIKGQDAGGNMEGFYRAPMDGVYRLEATYNGRVIGGTSAAECGELRPCPVLSKANPPAVKKAQFSDSGGHIIITFDSATDKANQEGRFACGKVLHSASLAVLSEKGGATCAWMTPLVLDVSLEYGATVQVNDDLLWAPGMIKLAPACLQSSPSVCFEHSRTVEGSARVARPANAISPTAVLKAPRKVGPCDSIAIDASSSSGSGGRQLQYFFGLQPGTANDAAVRKHLLGQLVPPYSLSQIVVPATLLLQGVDYTFVVRATNFLDQSDTAEIAVTKSYDDGPVLSIEGPSVVQVQASKAFKLRGNAELSSCSDPAKSPRSQCCAAFKVETGPITYAWSVAFITPPLPGGIVLNELTKGSRQLYVPANSLTPGYVYTMQFTGTMASNASSFGIANVDIDCVYAPLIAKISGGNRAHYAAEDLMLDATGSIDQDGALSSNPFTFRWSCQTSAGVGCFDDVLGIFRTTQGSLFIPRNKLLPGIYYFTVVASKEPGPRTASSTVETVVMPVAQFRTEVAALSVQQFNGNDELKLTGLVGQACNGVPSSKQASCLVQWSQIDGDAVLVHPTHLQTPVSLASLLFKTDVLQAGAFYRFRLSSTCPSERVGASPQSGFATVSVRINAPPGSGQFFVTPRSGRASSTVFTMSLVNWVDDLEDLPFTYEFRYATEASPEDLIPLAEVDVNSFASVLTGPSSATATSHVVTLHAHVIDQFAGKATVTSQVTVSRGGRRDSAQALKAMDKAMSESNAEAIIAIMISLTQDASLTCAQQDTFITTLQGVGATIVMSSTEIAGFQSALSAVLAATCVSGGSTRRAGDATVCNALGMTTGLLGSTMAQGLDPTAEKSSGSTLSSALDTISKKNAARRRLREVLGVSSGGGGDVGQRGRAVFRRGHSGGGSGVRAVATSCASSQGNMLMGALSGLADSQLNGAVTGQDAKTLNRGSIAMQASQALASSFVNATLGAGGSQFKTPSNMFATGQGSSLKARTSNLGSSPFDSDYKLGGVSSLTFGVDVSNLQEPIELSMPQTNSPGASNAQTFVCSANGTAGGMRFRDAAACQASCFSSPARPSATSQSVLGSNVTAAAGNTTAPSSANASAVPLGAKGSCSPAAASSCGGDAWSSCVDGVIDTCMFWNGKEWDGEGCIVHQMDTAAKKLVCHCYHLTDFGGAASDLLPTMNVVDPTNPAAVFANLSPDKILVICIVVGMLVLYWCLCYWGWRQDQADNAKYEDDMGMLSKKMTRNAHAREDNDMLLDANNMALLNKQMKGQFSRNLMMVKDKAMAMVKTEHKLFSGFFATRTFYTRPRRFTVLFCMIIGNMVCNAVFAGAENTSFIQKIIGGVLSSLLMILPTFFFKKVFMSMGVDPRTRARWEKQDELKFRARRTQLALTVTQGPTQDGMAAPPSDLKRSAAPARMNRGYVPNPDQERMIIPGDLQQGGPAYKRRSTLNRAAAGGGAPTGPPSAPRSGRPSQSSARSAPSSVPRSVRVAGASFGTPTPPPPAFTGVWDGSLVGPDGEVEGTPVEVGAFIPRRALPLSGRARPPAPVVTPDPAEGGQEGGAGTSSSGPSGSSKGSERAGVHSASPSQKSGRSDVISQAPTVSIATTRPPPPIPEEYQTAGYDEDEFGGEKTEGMQGHALHSRKSQRAPLTGLAKFEHRIATSVVRNLSKPNKSLSDTRNKRMIDYRFQWLAYLMAFMWYMTACYFAILYGVAFSTAIEQAWLIAFFVSVLQDLFINETLILSIGTSVKYVVVPNAAGWLAARIVSRYQ